MNRDWRCAAGRSQLRREISGAVMMMAPTRVPRAHRTGAARNTNTSPPAVVTRIRTSPGAVFRERSARTPSSMRCAELTRAPQHGLPRSFAAASQSVAPSSALELNGPRAIGPAATVAEVSCDRASGQACWLEAWPIGRGNRGHPTGPHGGDRGPAPRNFFTRPSLLSFY